MDERRPHSIEALRERRRLQRRRFRARRLAFGAVAIAATAAGVALGAPHGSPARAEFVDPPAQLFTHARVFPKRDRLRSLPYVAVAGRRGREIALTFDDGPGPYTLGVVRELRRLHAPATFFQVGATEH